MCNTFKMLVLFFILFIIQSNSEYRNEPFVFLKPSNRGLNSHSENSDIYNRNKRQRLEQIRARHENKLTVNTEKCDLGVDASKILLDNKDAEIFHNKNIHVKRSAKFKSKANKNTYNKFGYIYANEEEDSMKENMDYMPQRRHENKHPFEKLILKKIKAYDVPLQKKKGSQKNGFRGENKKLKSKTNYIGNPRQNNVKFIPNLLELQKYRAELNKAQVENHTVSPIISSDDYAEDEPSLVMEDELLESSSVEESIQYETECVTVDVNNTTSLTINKTEPTLSTNTTILQVTNTTECITTSSRLHDKAIRNTSSDKSDSTFSPHKIDSVTDSSKNVSTVDPSKSNLTLEMTTQNVSEIEFFDTVQETPSTTCKICFTLFPSFGTEADDNNTAVTSVTENTITSSLSSNVTSSTSNITVTSTLATTKSTSASNNKQSTVSTLTTEDSTRTGRSQKLTKRNLPMFEYNLFESVDTDVTNGNNLMRYVTTCIDVKDLLAPGTTESLQSSDVKTPAKVVEANLLSETTDTTCTTYITTERQVPTERSGSFIETTTATCMTVFKYTVPERVKPNATVVVAIPQTESVSFVAPTGVVTNLTTGSPIYNYTHPEIAAKKEEESEISTPSVSVIVNTLPTKIDMPKLDQMSTSNLTVNVSLLLAQMDNPSMLPNATFTVHTPIINYTYPLTQTVQEPAKLTVFTLQNVTTECITTGPMISDSTQLQHPLTSTEKPVQLTSMPLAAVGNVLNMTQNATLTTKHGFAMKLPHIKLPIINKTQQSTELPICTEKFTIFPQKINTTISKLAVYTFHKAAMHSESPCVYASVITKQTKKSKVPETTIRLIVSQPISTHTPSELPKSSTVEGLPATLQHLTLPNAPIKMVTLPTTCMTVFKYTVPPPVPIKTETLPTTCMTVFKHTFSPHTSVYVKAPMPAFQPSLTPPSPSELSVITPPPTVQQIVAEITSNDTQTTSLHVTPLKYTDYAIEHSQHTVKGHLLTAQQLMPLTTLLPDIPKVSVSPSEATVKTVEPESVPSEATKFSVAVPSPTKLIPDSAPIETPKPLTVVPLPTFTYLAPETSEGLQTAATTCMTVFNYTMPPPIDKITVKAPVPTDQQLVLPTDQQLVVPTDQNFKPQTTTCETVSQLSSMSNDQQLIIQTTLSSGDTPIPLLPTQILSPSGVQQEPCIPVPIVPGRAKGNKVYPIRHKGGDPGNFYFRKQQATKRFSKHPLLCTTIKFVECTTQYQPVLQRILQNTEKVFIPKAIATKAEAQTCKPDSSDCSSCDFGNVLPEIFSNKVELPPNPMPPVNLDFSTGNNDTDCVDLNQILNFTSTP